VFNGDTTYITQLKQQKSKRCYYTVKCSLLERTNTCAVWVSRAVLLPDSTLMLCHIVNTCLAFSSNFCNSVLNSSNVEKACPQNGKVPAFIATFKNCVSGNSDTTLEVTIDTTCSKWQNLCFCIVSANSVGGYWNLCKCQGTVPYLNIHYFS